MKDEKSHLIIKANGLGLCLIVLFFGVLLADIALSQEDMELVPQVVILLMAGICAGISLRLLMKKGWVWDRLSDSEYRERKSSLNRWLYEYFHPFKIRYEDAPPDAAVLEKKLTSFRKEFESFCKGLDLRYTVTVFFHHMLMLQRKRLERLGLRLEASFERKRYTKEEPVREESFFDGRFMHTVATEHVAGFYRYLRGGQIVYEQQNNDCADYDLVGARYAKDGQEVTCPSCGSVASMEEMAGGCPYCGVKFRMEDLSERVASFALRKDYQLLETVFQGKLYAYAKTIIFAAALLVCSIAVWWIDPLDGLTVTGFSFGIGAFLFIAALCLLATVVSVMVISVPVLSVLGLLYGIMRPFLFPHVRREQRTNASSETAARFDENFSLQDFFSNVENKLSGIHFAETEGQINAYANVDLSNWLVKYKDVASCTFEDLELLDFRVEGEKQLARVRAGMQLLHWQNGTMKEEKEVVELLLVKSASCLTQAVFEPLVLRCQGCGASLDLMEGRRCSYCGQEMELEEYDWCISEYKPE